MLGVVLLIVLIINFKNCEKIDKATIKYYEELITSSMEEANRNVLDTNYYKFVPKSDEIKDYGEFDFIVVGGGSSGGVIANRLSEINNWKVLLIEGGGDENDFSDIPMYMSYLQYLRFNWGFKSIPQKTCCQSMRDKMCPFPRGKSLGGTSVINVMMYVRGNKKDYDKWASLGNPGWSYDEVLPLFKMSENSKLNGDLGYHGTGGLLNVQYVGPNNLQFDAFIKANEELGRKQVDYNGKKQLGVAQTQFTCIDGRRDSTGKAFVKPASKRKNLHIRINSFVTKVIIHKRKTEAEGVIFSYKNQLYKAMAKKEVIISAGSVGSPQILMLSGIGPADHLSKLNIPLIQNLSVGQNLQNHPTFFNLYINTNYTEPVESLPELIQQYLHGRGPLTISGNNQGVGFFQTKYAKDEGVPDIEMQFIPSNNTNPFYKKISRFTEEAFESTVGRINIQKAVSFYIMLLHPKSIGSVKLKSNYPYDHPLIDPNYFSDEGNMDLEVMYEGIQLARQMLETNAFKVINSQLVDITLPACSNYERFSKEYWFCQIKQLAYDIYHPLGTCKMGPKPEEGAVVDSNNRVHGVKKLLVADASVMPFALSGNLNAPCIMIGEKVALYLKRKHKFHH